MAERVGVLDNLCISMAVREDRSGKNYFFATTHLPGSIDLHKTLFIIFPYYDEEGHPTGADLRIKEYQPRRVPGKQDDVNSTILCPDCGESVPLSRYCPECGEKLPKRTRTSNEEESDG